MALGVNRGYGESPIRVAMMDLQEISVRCRRVRSAQSRAEQIEMSVHIEICQMAVRSNEQVVVCFDEGAISHTQHHHWIICKDNVRMSVSVNVSYRCTFYPTYVCESKSGRDNLLELT